MDPLTQTIALLRPRVPAWKQLEATGDWAFRFPAITGIAFCLVAAGRCRFQVGRRAARPLEAGDYVLLTAPPSWSLAGGKPVTPVDAERVRAGSARRARVVRPGDGPVTRLFGGHFVLDRSNAGLLDNLMPAVVEIRSSAPTATRLRGVLELVDNEAMADRPGRTVILERLLEVMLVEAIRDGASQASEGRTGLLAGLADPQLATALGAFHGEIRRGWTVAQLAAVAGMSRSVFAERFTRVVGLPPIDYVVHWRMAFAKDALRFGRRRLTDVAGDCGYRSVSAFSTAFRRTVGCSPARYAHGEAVSASGPPAP